MLNRKILFIIVFLLAINTVHSIGIAPSLKVIDFQPLAEKTVTFYVHNNENIAFNAKIEFRGHLSEFITTKKDIIYIPAEQEFTPFNIIISMPEKIEKPGFYSTDIIATQLSSAKTEPEQTQIATSPSVIGKLNILVPYPEKYIEAELIIESIDNSVRFIMPIINYGSLTTDVNAVLEIHDKTKIAELKTNTISLEKGAQSKLETIWSYEKGNYDVKANINYDNKIIELIKNFDLGKPFMNITKIVVNKFNLGEIAELDIYLKNIWNKPNEVYLELILEKNKKQLVKTTTPSKIIDSYSEDAITAYLDTKDIQEGTYNLKIIAYYAGQITEKTTEIEITEKEAKGPLIQPPIRINILVITLIILAIAVILHIIYLIKKKKPKDPYSKIRI